MATPNADDLHLSDSDSDALFDTPAARKNKSKAKVEEGDATEGAAAGKTRAKESHYTTEETREAELRRELENVRNVNKVIEGVVESLQKAKDNMGTVSRTVHNASTLLQTWTRILSQTEHNQRLILNPQWQGVNQDLADMQNDELQRQNDTRRREAEEQAKREAAARRAEEERKRAEAPTPKPGTRGRGRGSTRARAASSTTSSGYGAAGGQSGRGLTRSSSTNSLAGSGIGRGLRGRGRGLG